MRPAPLALASILVACTPPPATAPPASGEATLGQSATGEAAAAIDPARCQAGRGRLLPFVVSWDATEQTELAAHSQQALAVVKLSGCSLELLPACRIPGEYRFRETTGSLQSLVVSSRDELYAKLPLSVVELSGELGQQRALTLRYFVRGFRYATAPTLYRSQLPAGCEGATHFVLNYATGAYELDVERGEDRSVQAGALGAGAGQRHDEGRRVVYQGGDIEACRGAKRCDAPIRLRLLPILEGEPPEEAAEAVARALTKPSSTGAPEHKRSPEAIQAAVRATYPSFRSCYDDMLGRSPKGSGTIDAHFTIEADGVVSQLDLVVKGDFDDTFIECFREVLYGVRFSSANGKTTIVYPLVFTPGE